MGPYVPGGLQGGSVILTLTGPVPARDAEQTWTASRECSPSVTPLPSPAYGRGVSSQALAIVTASLLHWLDRDESGAGRWSISVKRQMPYSMLWTSTHARSAGVAMLLTCPPLNNICTILPLYHCHMVGVPDRVKAAETCSSATSDIPALSQQAAEAQH